MISINSTWYESDFTVAVGSEGAEDSPVKTLEVTIFVQGLIARIKARQNGSLIVHKYFVLFFYIYQQYMVRQ